MKRRPDVYRRTRRALREGHTARTARREAPGAALTALAGLLRRYRGEVVRRIEELEDAVFLGLPFVYQPPAFPVLVDREPPSPLLMMPLPIDRRPMPFLAMITAVLAIALLPLTALAQTTPEPVRFELLSTIGTLTKAGKDKTPIVGMRATVDVPTVAGIHLLLRADLSRMSDGGAVDAGGIVPSFDSGEAYIAAFRRVAGPLAIEAVIGRAFALDPDAEVLETSPEIWGGGLRLEVRGGYVFAGLGRHGAAGAGTRLLVSLLVPAKSNTNLLVDGAIGERGKSVIRSGIAVRF